MSSKRNKQPRLGLSDWQVLIRKTRRSIWDKVKHPYGKATTEHGPVCFDCGKSLPNADKDGIIMMDWTGVLFFCDDCVFTRIHIMETWKRVFERCAKRK